MFWFFIVVILFIVSKTILPFLAENKFFSKGLIGLVLIGLFNFNFFYADPGYQYHVRTLLSQERHVNQMGWSYNGGGTVVPWKNDMTIQVQEGDEDVSSSHIVSPKLVFLDQVDADGYATARFNIPKDTESFYKMVHAYRTPENLINTELVPAFKTTLQATAGLMSAEEYFSGSKTVFLTEFQNQLEGGVYLVKREEVRVVDNSQSTDVTANASLDAQKKSNQKYKVVFQVKKQEDSKGSLIRQPQNYSEYGITLVSARVTNVKPNAPFLNRMKAKQKASADNSIAREQRIQEEQQRLLAIAKGNRQVAERQAEAKVKQIAKTTDAETNKQLALTKATQAKEQAAIDKETATLLLGKAKIDAIATKVSADAEAYKRLKIIRSDNALQAKIDAEVEIQKYWSDAYAKRAVPKYVFGATGGSPTGSDSEGSNLMKLLTMQAAKALDYNRDIK